MCAPCKPNTFTTLEADCGKQHIALHGNDFDVFCLMHIYRQVYKHSFAKPLYSLM